MDRLDREVLALRHSEHLSPAKAAQVMGIKEKAAGMRYVRALRRLAEQSISKLRRAVAAGPKEVDWMERDPELRGLHDHHDFRELIQSPHQAIPLRSK